MGVLFWNPKESDFTMLLKEFLIATVLIISVTSVNARFNEVQKKFKELGYNVQFQMVIKNAVAVQNQRTTTLEYRSLDVTSGQTPYMETMNPPKNISSRIGQKPDGFLGHKVGYAATGCAGTVTYEILKTRGQKRFLTVMYSVPYSHDFHSN